MISPSRKAAAIPLYAAANLDGFEGAALLVSNGGHVSGANAEGVAILAAMSEAALYALTTSVGRAIAAQSIRLERLLLSESDLTLDAVILPLTERQGGMVLVSNGGAERQSRRSLLESRERYLDLVRATSDFVWETDREGRFTYLSGEGAFGWETRDMLGRPASDFVVDASLLPYPVFQAREPVLQTDVWLQHADGQISCQSITAVPVFDAEGSWSGTRGMGRDVTSEREAERRERQKLLRERLMAYLADTLGSHPDPDKTLPAALSGVGLAINAVGGMILKGHPELAHCEVMPWGEPLPEVDLPAIQEALAEQGAVDLLRDGWQLIGHVTIDSYAAQSKVNGALLFWTRASGGGFGDGDRAILKEVASQVGLSLVRLAGHGEPVRSASNDSLTGLSNRRAFFADLRRRLKRLLRSGSAGTLLYVDIDRLQALNETRGRAAGDQAMVVLAGILRQATRPTDLTARIGGDEFVAWLEGVGEADASARAEALLDRCRSLGTLSALGDYPVGISIGVAVFNGGHAETLEQLIIRAESALKGAKNTARRFAVAPPGTEVAAAPHSIPDPGGAGACANR